jgi:ABC-type glycerol-3-phosphate transport system substrate-binding protein
MSLHQRSAPRRLMGVSAAAACIALLAAGCSSTPSTSSPPGTAASGAPTSGPTESAGSSTGSQYGFPTVAQDPTAKITVWVDADRSAIAEAFEKDHPECPLTIETYDASAGGSDTFHTKISLLDQAGSGWPDVAWSGQVNDASWAAH